MVVGLPLKKNWDNSKHQSWELWDFHRRISGAKFWKLKLDVSKNRGVSPKMDGSTWKILLKWMIWGYHYFRKPPTLHVRHCGSSFWILADEWKVVRAFWQHILAPEGHELVTGFSWEIPTNGGFLKWWYPQIIHLNRVFHFQPSILGYPYFWKHPNQQIFKNQKWSPAQ